MFKKVIGSGKHALEGLLYALFGLFPINDCKAMFSSFLGGSYSDNPRAISEELHRVAPAWQIVWVVKSPKEKAHVVPAYVTLVRAKSIASIYHRATSKFWVENYTLGFNIRKRRGQIYIQTWHGDRGFKKVLADMLEDKNQYRSYEAKHCDLAISGSDFSEMFYRSSFLYDGAILRSGTPKCDVLINNPEQAGLRVRSQYQIPDDVKVLLYAPTFRDSSGENIQVQKTLDMKRVLSAFCETFGSTWVLMVRGHTGRTIRFEKSPDLEYYDTTQYEDSADVLAAADALITDYSSVAGDYILMKRPIFIYVDDYDDYLRNSRSLWFDLGDMPFVCAVNQDSLIEQIRNTTYESASNVCEKAMKAFGTHESGHAAEDVCKYMLSC